VPNQPAGRIDGRSSLAAIRGAWESGASSTASHAAPAARRRALLPEELFLALDGRRLSAPAGSWRLEIYSICDQHGIRWIQLAMKGHTSHTLTVQVEPWRSGEEVLEMLASRCDWEDVSLARPQHAAGMGNRDRRT
jgi:hypothetical protein